MNMKDAVTAAKNGAQIRRAAWPDGVALYLKTPSESDAVKLPHLRVVGAANPWQATGDDMTADDWSVVPEASPFIHAGGDCHYLLECTHGAPVTATLAITGE